MVLGKIELRFSSGHARQITPGRPSKSNKSALNAKNSLNFYRETWIFSCTQILNISILILNEKMKQSAEPIPRRPKPAASDEADFEVDSASDPKSVVKRLKAGEIGVVTDEWPSGLRVLSELRRSIFKKGMESDFQTYREERADYSHASNRLLAPVKEGRIDLKKAPEIGWLDRLYPDVDQFLLSVPELQGLNSSWQWYLKGIQFPVLSERVYPFYGTYFPTRFDHLILFDEWLQNYSAGKKSALDIGTGCGVLAFQMLKFGFQHVTAVDNNPNAILSVLDHLKRYDLGGKVNAIESDLFEKVDAVADLIVFNPPWLPADGDVEGLDRAIYYKEGLFERFFEESIDYLNKQGSLVILFSNLSRKEGLGGIHPVEKEIALNDRYKKVQLIRRDAEAPSKKTRRRAHRKNETVELWELQRVS